MLVVLSRDWEGILRLLQSLTSEGLLVQTLIKRLHKGRLTSHHLNVCHIFIGLGDNVDEFVRHGLELFYHSGFIIIILPESSLSTLRCNGDFLLPTRQHLC